MIALAQFHVNANGRNRHKLHKAIIEALSPDVPPTENHKLLAKLPIKTWWTTNYDRLIETSLRDEGKVVDVKSAVPQLATTRPRRDATLYKMHGDVERPDQAVATRDDFERYSVDRAAFITALAGDLVSKTFLFLGYSFSDPNLEHVLSQIRLTFTENQRAHYAIFRRRQKGAEESDQEFLHHSTRQSLVIEDLKRFNIKVLLIDDFPEITDVIRELLARFRRRTISISGSAMDFGAWGNEAVSGFAQKLAERLVKSGCRVATGLGLGIGDGILTGALREIASSRDSIEDVLVLRPFPQAIPNAAERDKLWNEYRTELISHAGIAIFLFGNKRRDGKIVDADGVIKEFEIAHDQGVVIVPLGCTGWASAEIADTVIEDAEAFGWPSELLPELRALQDVPESLMSLIDPIERVIRHLQGREG
jgi:hypothetical protein